MGRTQSGLPAALSKFLRVLSRGKENDTLLEADPVGEFLARKRAGVMEPGLAGVKPNLPPVLTGLVPDPAEDDARETDADSEDGAADVEEAAVQEISSCDQDEDMPSPVLEEPSPYEDTMEEDASESDSENVARRETTSEVAATPEKEENDEEIKSLLEIFKNEQLSESPISTLSKELSDTNVYSLLNETKEVARRFRRTANLHQISGDFFRTDDEEGESAAARDEEYY